MSVSLIVRNGDTCDGKHKPISENKKDDGDNPENTPSVHQSVSVVTISLLRFNVVVNKLCFDDIYFMYVPPRNGSINTEAVSKACPMTVV